jgi:hypothetical protein
MKKLALVCILMWLGLIVQACGSSNGNGTDGGVDGGNDKTLVDYLPASGEVTGWEENTDYGEPGPEATTDVGVATIWVNGAITRFTDTGGWVGLAIEFYKNGDWKTKLTIYEMDDNQSAQDAYVAMADYEGVPWTDFDFGAGQDSGRFGTVGTFYCYADAVKGKYFVETVPDPVNADTETMAKDFFTAVLNKLP